MSIINRTGSSIENGYFVLTMMPSLFCPYNCSHCYLSKEQRRDSYVMPISDVRRILIKIDEYYSKSGIQNKKIVAYFYGGEPLSMGLDYFEQMMSVFSEVLSKEKGYTVNHIILTSLLGEDLDIWGPFVEKYCDGYLQTSFDGLMRGKGYLKKWERKVKEAVDGGLNVGTISVVNSELIKAGADSTIDYLSELGIVETGWLPFMENLQNKGIKYDKYAPSMTAFNDFMIALLDRWSWRTHNNYYSPRIGEAMFAANNLSVSGMNNLAVQTLFLLPNGDICLPDYRDGYTEYMNVFGNILKESFLDVLHSPKRQEYLRRQLFRNHNPECQECEFSQSCLLEFAKPFRENDECFGAKRFIEYLSQHSDAIKLMGRYDFA